MIQRTQTVFLFIVIIIGVTNFINPLFEVRGDVMPVDIVAKLIAIHASRVYLRDSYLFASLNAIVITLALITVFLFKKRQVQLKLCRLMLLVISGLIVAIFFSADSYIKTAGDAVHYCTGSFLPIMQIMCTVTALLFIKKDDELVRAADRLR